MSPAAAADTTADLGNLEKELGECEKEHVEGKACERPVRVRDTSSSTRVEESQTSLLDNCD